MRESEPLGLTSQTVVSHPSQEINLDSQQEAIPPPMGITIPGHFEKEEIHKLLRMVLGIHQPSIQTGHY